MIARYGAYGAKSASDQLADKQADLARELAKKNPGATRLQNLRADIATLTLEARQEEGLALKSFAQRTGLDQALAAYAPPPPEVRTETVSVPASKVPLIAGAIVLLAAWAWS